jgi:hypothetical protein
LKHLGLTKEEYITEAIPEWWKDSEGPEGVLTKIYWQRGQVPGGIDKKKWQNLVNKLQKHRPAPSATYKKWLALDPKQFYRKKKKGKSFKEHCSELKEVEEGVVGDATKAVGRAVVRKLNPSTKARLARAQKSAQKAKDKVAIQLAKQERTAAREKLRDAKKKTREIRSKRSKERYQGAPPPKAS